MEFRVFPHRILIFFFNTEARRLRGSERGCVQSWHFVPLSLCDKNVVQLKAYHVSRVVVFVHPLGETEKPKQSPGFIASNGDSRHPTARLTPYDFVSLLVKNEQDHAQDESEE